MILTACNGTEFGKHLIIARILKGIFRNRPALSGYMVTSDLELVLNFLKSLPSWDDITLKGLSKTVTILALLSGLGFQSINSLSLAHMDININKVLFYMPKAIKNAARLFHRRSLLN